jgi:hypothetical protein
LRKYLYTILGLALLLALLVPSTVMAQEEQCVTKLPENLVGMPGYENGGWKFVIPGNLETYAPPCFTITWDNGATSEILLQREENGAAFYQLLVSEIPEGATKPVLASFMFKGKLWEIPLTCSHVPCPPVPELPVVALMAVGLVGLGTVVFLKRRTLFPTLG